MQSPIMIAMGRFFFYHRNWLFPVLIALLFLVWMPRPAGAFEALLGV